jgi:transcriptional regulator with XRE-family HTH domain
VSEAVTYSDVVRANVRTLRERAGLSQYDLAERMRILGFPWHGSTTNSLEQGRRYPNVAELVGLALSLGVDVTELLDPAGVGPETTISLGDVPPLPYGYARAIVRANLEAAIKPTDILDWEQDSNGNWSPTGWWVRRGRPAVNAEEVRAGVRDVLVRAGGSGHELDEALEQTVQALTGSGGTGIGGKATVTATSNVEHGEDQSKEEGD